MDQTHTCHLHHDPQVALRTAQKEVERLKALLDAAGNSAAVKDKQDASSSGKNEELAAKLAQMEGALRQATADYQMLLGGGCLGLVWCRWWFSYSRKALGC